MLCLIMAFGAVSSLSVTAFSAEETVTNVRDIPKSVLGTDNIAGVTTQWNMKLSYNSATKSLSCKSFGEDSYDALYNYLYTMSTDSAGNRFIDRENPTSTQAGTNFKDLFSVDPIRNGLIKSIVLIREDKKGTYLTGVYTFEVKNGRLIRTMVTSPRNYYSKLSQLETRYEYDAAGKITKISKNNLSLEVPCRVDATYTYDSKARPEACHINILDFTHGVSISSYKQTFRRFGNSNWPAIIAEQDLSDGDVSLQTLNLRFNPDGQIARDGRVYFYYDTLNRLVKTQKTYRSGVSGDGVTVEYSSFITI